MHVELEKLITNDYWTVVILPTLVVTKPDYNTTISFAWLIWSVHLILEQ